MDRIAQKIVVVNVFCAKCWVFVKTAQERREKFVSFRSARIRKGISRAEAAAEFGVTTGTIGTWERGISSPPKRKLVAVARYYGVSVKSLFDGEMIKKPLPQKKKRSKAELTDREKAVITARMNGETFEEIGETHGVTRQAAHNIYSNAMRKLGMEGSWKNA